MNSCPVLSFYVSTVIDTFLFKLIPFRFSVNPIFIPVFGLPNFVFISIINCKSENMRELISTDPFVFILVPKLDLLAYAQFFDLHLETALGNG
jgi:hypothetical protein